MRIFGHMAAVLGVVGFSFLGFAAGTHTDHTHKHGPKCGHKKVLHNGHEDYLHDGHLHHVTKAGAVEEHKLEVKGEIKHEVAKNAPANHKHGPDCGHEKVPHGDHFDYLVNNELHHEHGDHFDDHGHLTVH